MVIPSLALRCLGLAAMVASVSAAVRNRDRVDDGLVLERDLADRCRQCEDDMKVRHRQQFGLPIREPLGPRQPLAFGTVTVATRDVSDAGCTEIVALLDIAYEHLRPALPDGSSTP